MNRKNSEEVDLNTNPYDIYPDMDDKVDPNGKPECEDGFCSDTVTAEEIIQQADLTSPDPNTLDRG